MTQKELHQTDDREAIHATTTPAFQLDILRKDIDRIDAQVHHLLIERSSIIDKLIVIKAQQGGGSAFRPDREAAMMRALVERHHGILPLETVESIWRIIISTFTFVQAFYRLHADVSDSDTAMRDSARFHFGFSVPFIGHNQPREVISAVSGSQGDLGILRVQARISVGPWWRDLIGKTSPKIIARLPFIERDDHPAALPVFIIARPLAEAASKDAIVYALDCERWMKNLPLIVEDLGGEIMSDAADKSGLGLLLCFPGTVEEGEIRSKLESGKIPFSRLDVIGSHASPYILGR